MRPDVAEDPAAYDQWVRLREISRCSTGTTTPPSASPLRVVMVIEGPPPFETSYSLQSLAAQTSSHWSLTIAVGRSWQPDLTSHLSGSAIKQNVDIVACDSDATYEESLESAFSSARGQNVALISPGDVWAPDAVALLSAALPFDGVAYADEDIIDDAGRHADPRLKPVHSPEFLLHADCVGRPLAMSAGVIERLPPGAAGVRAARDHDLALRACQVARSVQHVPEVLCHRRLRSDLVWTESPGATDHVVAALGREGSVAEVVTGHAAGTFRIKRTARSVRTASIVIPFRDQPRLLRACIDSIERSKGEIAAEYVLIDNASVQPETMTLLERLAGRDDVEILRDDRPFNWAALNNAGAARATGDVLVFLNNDIEALSQGWLDALCAQAERRDIGAVGARLLYPDRRLQHCGVVIGLGGAAGHLFVGLNENSPGYMTMAVATRECSGVTGACIATARKTFEEHSGFDESLGIDLNDIDYCMRLQGAGLRVLYEPEAELIHYESPSRGTAGDVRDIVHFIDRWKTSILDDDPYLSPHLTRMDSSCALRAPGEAEWWQRWYAGLADM